MGNITERVLSENSDTPAAESAATETDTESTTLESIAEKTRIFKFHEVAPPESLQQTAETIPINAARAPTVPFALPPTRDKGAWEEMCKTLVEAFAQSQAENMYQTWVDSVQADIASQSNRENNLLHWRDTPIEVRVTLQSPAPLHRATWYSVLLYRCIGYRNDGQELKYLKWPERNFPPRAAKRVDAVYHINVPQGMEGNSVESFYTIQEYCNQKFSAGYGAAGIRMLRCRIVCDGQREGIQLWARIAVCSAQRKWQLLRSRVARMLRSWAGHKKEPQLTGRPVKRAQYHNTQYHNTLHDDAYFVDTIEI